MTDEEMISNFMKDNKVTQRKTSYQDKTDSKKNKKCFNRDYKKEELRTETDYTVKKMVL